MLGNMKISKLSSNLRRISLLSSNTATRVLTSSLSTKASENDIFTPTDQFQSRHMGSQHEFKRAMLDKVGFSNLSTLIDSSVPQDIRLNKDLIMDPPMSESEALTALKIIMSKNQVKKSFIGMGYYEVLVPNVIQRNLLENPGWYTSYTPYQAEIAQGRLQSLLNFQTMVSDLTGMTMCNASLLDESTAAAEAMNMCHSLLNKKRNKFFISERCHPQNIALCQTRGDALGIHIVVGDVEKLDMSKEDYFGVLIQYPDTYGNLYDWTPFTNKAHASSTLVVGITDLMASTLLKPVGEMGIDIAVGSAQRFGVPMGFGGPHAAYLACKEKYARMMPGRIIGVSKDSRGKSCLRMAMQTREQHIRRDKATSNICTAQALLANMASMYGVYHGPRGLKNIATRIHLMTKATADTLIRNGFRVHQDNYFDTFTVDVAGVDMVGFSSADVQARASMNGVNVRIINNNTVGISFGEAITKRDIVALLDAFNIKEDQLSHDIGRGYKESLVRTTPFMTHPVFNTHHSESQMMRYLKYLENKDLSLNFSMIALGSCTMKLNAAVEMVPVTWPETGNMHPFAPQDQTLGYKHLIASLNKDLAKITGFAAISTQPNSGAQGEYAGLLTIQKYHESRGDHHRNVCLIPVSAHGTNPASASMCNMKVVIVKCDDEGNFDMVDFHEKVQKYKANLSCLMVTYPSTYGKFDVMIREIIDTVHEAGGQVYMDGANMNAQVAITSPGHIGADVCHLNLHKTFCIPHGGGGPGVGSIGVAKHLAPFLPGHPVVQCSGEGINVVNKLDGNVSAAPYGSASILPITWMYIKMLGEKGLKEATSMAILNANYMLKRMEENDAYDILYKGHNGQCAHEFIVDLRGFKKYGIVEEDVAKRLQDYGFHSPTMSFPVVGTLMIEPTESEDKEELDRFCDAMISIRKEIQDIIDGKMKVEDSPLKGAPHTMDMVCIDNYNRKYSREVAAFPAPWINSSRKFWPTVGRVDNVYGDRNLICSCPPVESYIQ